MTAVLETSVEKIYQQVFGDILTEMGQKRKSFLESVVAGKVTVDGQEIIIEQAQGLAQSESQREELDIMVYLGRWYKALAGNSHLGSGTRIFFRGQPEYVTKRLDDCKKVLFEYKRANQNVIATLLEPLYDALKLRNGARNSAIGNAATALLETGNQDIRNIVMKELVTYNNELRRDLDKALKAENMHDVQSIAQMLLDSKNPDMVRYTEGQLGKYGHIIPEKKKEGHKEINPDAGKITSEVKVPLRRWKWIGIGLTAAAAGTALAVYLGLFSGNSFESSKQGQHKSDFYAK